MDIFSDNTVMKHFRTMLPLCLFVFSQTCLRADELSCHAKDSCGVNECSEEIEYIDFAPWESGDDAGLWCLPGSRCTYACPTSPSSFEIYEDISQLVHKPQYPSKYNPDEWKTVMMHMRVILPMTACDYRQVLNFMQNKPVVRKKHSSIDTSKSKSVAVESGNKTLDEGEKKELAANVNDKSSVEDLENIVGPVSKLDNDYVAPMVVNTSNSFSKINHVFTGYFNLDYNSPTSSYFADFDGNRSFSYLMVPIWLARYGDSLLLASKFAFYNFGQQTVFSLPYCYATIFYNDYLTIQFGKIIIPFGTYYALFNPGWIEKCASNPLGRSLFDFFAITPSTDIGIEVEGAIPLCSVGPKFADSSVSYQAWIGNGMSEKNVFSPPFPGGIEYDTPGTINYGIGQANSPNNNSKFTLGGRLGFSPTNLQNYGISYMRGRWSSNKRNFGANKNLYFEGAVFDWNINFTPYTVFRGEYIWTQYENNAAFISNALGGIPVNKWVRNASYWAQLSFNLGVLRCFADCLYCWHPCFWDSSEIVFRSDAVWSQSSGNNIVFGFGGFDQSGYDKRRFTLTYGYYFTQSFTAKLEYAFNYGEVGFNPFREAITGQHRKTGFAEDVFTFRLSYGW
jgi:hypothetical protein